MSVLYYPHVCPLQCPLQLVRSTADEVWTRRPVAAQPELFCLTKASCRRTFPFSGLISSFRTKYGNLRTSSKNLHKEVTVQSDIFLPVKQEAQLPSTAQINLEDEEQPLRHQLQLRGGFLLCERKSAISTQ